MSAMLAAARALDRPCGFRRARVARLCGVVDAIISGRRGRVAGVADIL
jgi:hypothetical protein